MTSDTLMKTGVIGTVLAALCCFSPVLVWTLAALGLSAIPGWLDYALLSALAVFAAMTLFALGRRRAAAGRGQPTGGSISPQTDHDDPPR